MIRDGVRYDFEVNDGAKIKESGASNSESGQAKEQGDTFFTTNDDINSYVKAPRADGPFSGLEEGKLAFATNSVFVEGEVTSIVREQELLDDEGDPIGTENANFYTGENTAFPCFVSGTRILTPSGYVSVDCLRAGDMVSTLDNGAQPLCWVVHRRIRASYALAPIRIRAGAMGNFSDLLVSPQHKMLVSGWQAEVFFGEKEVLVAAKHLINDYSVQRESGIDYVTYYHLLLGTHEIIDAEGAATESLNPASLTDWPKTDPSRIEIETLFPELFTSQDTPALTARAALKAFEGNLLAFK